MILRVFDQRLRFTEMCYLSGVALYSKPILIRFAAPPVSRKRLKIFHSGGVRFAQLIWCVTAEGPF